MKMTKSYKKFIRQEKSKIRKQFFDVKKQDELIKGLYDNFLVKPKNVVLPEKAKEKKVKDKPKKEKVKK